MHRFYAPDFGVIDEVQLPEDEAQHLARVLRLTAGDAIAVFDGKGREALARVESIDVAQRVACRSSSRAPRRRSRASR